MRDDDTIAIDIAYAAGNNLDIVDYLRAQHETRWHVDFQPVAEVVRYG